jgi:N-hydroxyarylamine O-acetyltransferase
MKASNFDLEAYFRRIEYEGDAKSNLATVSDLMRRQLFAVPFENLDVQAGKIVSMVPEEIVEKILKHSRGGYCYEVNGLFAMALDALGIPYRFVAARPMFYSVRRPRTHMAVVADVDGGRWLCDLGFGSYGIRAPMNIDALDVIVTQDFDRFRLMKDDRGERVLTALVEGAWVNQFAFDLSAQEWIDFVPANHLNSTHPDSIFVQKLLVVRHQPNGRSILVGDTLKTVRAGSVEKRNLSPNEIPTVLAREFGILPSAGT